MRVNNMKEKVLLVYNPKAGNGVFSNNLDRVILEFQKKGQIVVPMRASGKSGEIDGMFTGPGRCEFTKIIAAGGDGTVNAVVSSMMRNNIDLPLAIFPAGTANDLAYYFDIPTDITDMLHIATGRGRTKMDVGVAGSKYFVNVMAMGMLVDVSQKTDPAAKNTLGIMAYYLRSMAELPKLRPIPVHIKCPEFSRDFDIHAMLVMNGRSAGGFKRIAPESSINDGMFEVFIFKSMPVSNWGPFLTSLIQGRHTDNKYVEYIRTSELRIESEEDLITDVDGEPGDHLPIDIRNITGRLTICTRESDMKGNEW